MPLCGLEYRVGTGISCIWGVDRGQILPFHQVLFNPGNEFSPKEFLNPAASYDHLTIFPCWIQHHLHQLPCHWHLFFYFSAPTRNNLLFFNPSSPSFSRHCLVRVSNQQFLWLLIFKNDLLCRSFFWLQCWTLKNANFVWVGCLWSCSAALSDFLLWGRQQDVSCGREGTTRLGSVGAN